MLGSVQRNIELKTMPIDEMVSITRDRFRVAMQIRLWKLHLSPQYTRQLWFYAIWNM